MKKYDVYFTKYYHYVVEADDEDEAFDFAYEDFVSEMRIPIADTSYDEVEIIEGMEDWN